VFLASFSSWMVCTISAISRVTRGEADVSGPAWYLVRIAVASGARSWSISQRGDSGIQYQNVSWMRGKPACRMEGMRQERSVV